jgi:hypothetical protein
MRDRTNDCARTGASKITLKVFGFTPLRKKAIDAKANLDALIFIFARQTGGS